MPKAHPDDAADDLGFTGWGGGVELEWLGWPVAGDINQPSLSQECRILWQKT
jgi:hypothetical protein